MGLQSDRRDAVLDILSCEDGQYLSNREIARKCGVDGKTVQALRSMLGMLSTKRVVTRGGSKVEYDVKKIGKPALQDVRPVVIEADTSISYDRRIREFGRTDHARHGEWAFNYLLRRCSIKDEQIEYIYKIGRSRNIARRMYQYMSYGFQDHEISILHAEPDELESNEQTFKTWMLELGCGLKHGKEWFSTDDILVDRKVVELMNTMMLSENMCSDILVDYIIMNGLKRMNLWIETLADYDAGVYDKYK